MAQVPDGLQGNSNDTFPDTQWALVRSAAEGSERALEELCERYTGPVYAFFRRGGHTPDVSADLTQEFFTLRILDPEKRRKVLRDEDQLSVRFRTFLQTCLRNFAANVRDYEGAQKRGGGRRVSLDLDHVERSLALVQDAEPGQAFDLVWARELVDQVFQELRAEINAQARTVLLRTIEGVPDKAIAAELQVSVNAVAKTRQRTLDRARKILVRRLRDTVTRPEDLTLEVEELGRIYALPRWLQPE